MSDAVMSTEPGGEAQQYEGNLGLVDAPRKEAGQLGDPSTHTQPVEKAQTPSTGADTQHATSAGRAGAVGEADGLAGDAGEDEEKARRVQGYGGDADMDRGVGA